MNGRIARSLHGEQLTYHFRPPRQAASVRSLCRVSQKSSGGADFGLLFRLLWREEQGGYMKAIFGSAVATRVATLSARPVCPARRSAADVLTPSVTPTRINTLR